MSNASYDLGDKVFLVTGGRAGIGLAVVQALRSHGALVASLDRAPAGEADDAGRLDLVCDVTSRESVEAAVAAAVERFGGLDGLVQSAGITRDGMLWKLSDEAWRAVVDVNLTGAFNGLRAVTPALRARGGGSIVNVTSINGFRGKFGQSNYAASKAGLIGLTKTAARELGAFGIRVNAVAPGMVRTAMVAALPEAVMETALAESAIKRISEPEDVADAILFLLSARARQITGTTLRVDAGQCM